MTYNVFSGTLRNQPTNYASQLGCISHVYCTYSYNLIGVAFR